MIKVKPQTTLLCKGDLNLRPYRKDLNKRPGRLLNFWIFYMGAYIKGVLKRCWAVIKFARHSAKYEKYKHIK